MLAVMLRQRRLLRPQHQGTGRPFRHLNAFWGTSVLSGGKGKKIIIISERIVMI